MTRKKFMSELEKYGKGKFRKHENGIIRDKENDWCPILFVANKRGYSEYGSNFQYQKVAKKLGLSRGDAIQIACAADQTNGTEDDLLIAPETEETRKELEKVLGL